MNEDSLPWMPARAEMQRAVASGDATYDGVFVYGVQTTGIFCRPGCRPPRPALPRHCEFFGGVRAALEAGYRPCLRCRPEVPPGTPPAWLARLIGLLDADPGRRPDTETLRKAGVGPEAAGTWFERHQGMTLARWFRHRRLAVAFAALRDGEGIDEAVAVSGFRSHSGFRDAWKGLTGHPPGGPLPADLLWVQTLASPIGPLRATAHSSAIVGLGFVDRCPAPGPADPDRPAVPGPNPVLDRLQAWLDARFGGTGVHAAVPPPAADPAGTGFQRRVWAALCGIPEGTTWSYARLARHLGQPTATRAVAAANAANPVCLLIPCHRVIGADGSLGGYGGGLWRKRLLLELERTGRLPG